MISGRVPTDVHQRADKGSIGCALDPGGEVRGKGDCFVWAVEAKSTDHGGVNRVGRVDVKTFNHSVNEGSLGNGDSAGGEMSRDADAEGVLGLTEVRNLPL